MTFVAAMLIIDYRGRMETEGAVRMLFNNPGEWWWCVGPVGSNGGIKKWLDSEYSLKIESTGFPERLHLECKKNGKFKGDPIILVWTIGKMMRLFFGKRKTIGKNRCEQEVVHRFAILEMTLTDPSEN